MEDGTYLPFLARSIQILQKEEGGEEKKEEETHILYRKKKHDQWQNQNKYERIQMSAFTLVGGHKPEELALLGKSMPKREDMGFATYWLSWDSGEFIQLL